MKRGWWLFLLLMIFAAAQVLPVAGQTTDPAGANDEINRRKAQLEEELRQVEAQIAEQTKLLRATEQQKAGLQRDRDLLTYQINQAKLQIKAKKLEIQRLGGDIVKKEATIIDLNARIEEEKISLAELLRKTRDSESTSFVEVLLGSESVSSALSEVESYRFIEDSINQAFAQMRATRGQTEEAKNMLEDRRRVALDVSKEIEEEQRRVERKEAEKKQLIAITANQESAYRQVLAEREREKTRIKSALFRLRGSDSISFGQAVEHAMLISQRTGVRPAFLLAIITQESNLGANVGTCNRPGDPPTKHWKSIMKPDRDYAPFVRITQALGLDPEVVPLSCPYGGGYGGAMGPAQFIPSTWEGYQTRISAVTGNTPPNPWTPRDAFAASGLFLKDLGAAAGGYTAERTAALKYYAGGNWALAKNAFYGNEVMRIATEYQQLIDTLQNR